MKGVCFLNSDEIFEYYLGIKEKLKNCGFNVGLYKEINYGIQFGIAVGEKKAAVRIYCGKKGLRLDLSQIKDKDMLDAASNCIYRNESGQGNGNFAASGIDPEELIGTDESGKGDYFGPLVVAGVYTDECTAPKLRALGVDDSKKLTDKQIRAMAPKVKELCPYSIVLFENEKYNEMYFEIKNLNKLLAWGHARVIEDILKVVDCSSALSDQFGDPSLIQNALMERGRKISLEQRPRAEENIAVAAASVLARFEFISKIEEMEEHYKMEFPKGASSMVVDAGINFVRDYGIDELQKVAKLHFKTTSDIHLRK